MQILNEIVGKKARPTNFAASVRRLHTYIGLLIAPSLLFFACTGILQIYSMHESHGDYRASNLLKELAAVHKDQKFEAPVDRPGEVAHDASPEPILVPTQLLKVFFTLVAGGLIASVSMGIWMAVKFSRPKGLVMGLLAIGTILPIVLIAL